ncbi:hypothetical protein [Leptolyngbya iicbica]|uniref:Uncharacterized protein n=1 Tax=Lyngbya confervoides BDU141951 TaxID=1574623 RepID=A0A8T6QV33_9CYAN|nr:hypothetical protein [Leptolyngbya sp. LK]
MCSITFRAPESEKETLEAIAAKYRVPSSYILRTLLKAQTRGLVSFRDYMETTEETASV